jgi:hypothetical protein
MILESPNHTLEWIEGERLGFKPNARGPATTQVVLGSMARQPKEDWWTPQQTALVEDGSRHWRLTRFQPSDALAFESDGQTADRKGEPDDEVATAAHVVPDGWDHEHCALCWREISLIPGTDDSESRGVKALVFAIKEG